MRVSALNKKPSLTQSQSQKDAWVIRRQKMEEKKKLAQDCQLGNNPVVNEPNNEILKTPPQVAKGEQAFLEGGS